jgi:predicted O-methyltransferase YrrM
MDVTEHPDGTGWQVGDVSFVTGFGLDSTPERFLIRKPPELFRRYLDLGDRFHGGRIVELGIAAGGSTALLALLAAPRSLTACELAPEPVRALETFIEVHGLASIVRPCFGVDQSDRGRLAELIDSHAGGEALDLVVDDASHRYEPTLASFEVLFPMLRPGGWFIIEDWAADYAYARRIDAALSETSTTAAQVRRSLDEAVAAHPEGVRPLPRLGVELLQACGASPDVVGGVTVNRHWIVVERGPADLARDDFRLREHAPDHWHWLDH